MHNSALVIACLVAGLLAVVRVTRKSRQYRYPPGPKGLPLLKNLLDAPRTYSWLTYQAWGREYNSDIIHYEVFGLHFVVLNSTEAAKELLEGRSHIYSDRHETVMARDLTGWHRHWGIMAYGDAWRQRRRLFHQHFRPQAIPQYHDHILKSACTLLQLLLESPEAWMRHIHHVSGATVLKILYAMDVDPHDDEGMDVVDKALQSFMQLAAPFVVDFIPPLKHLPAWLPGAGFKRQAIEWKVDVDRMFEEPYRKIKAAAQSGEAQPCIATALLSAAWEDLENPDVEEQLISVLGTAYANSDTTIFSMYSFVSAMLLYPDVQRKAQAELDRVVGRDRLPEITDRESLPYFNAVLKEVFRWHPVTPIGAPHKSMEDDWYKGYFIPAGTIVIGNTWAILHDESRYAEPDAFKPERFLTPAGALDSTVPDPDEVFGFGRRICPGRYFVQDAFFLYAAHLLAAFTLSKFVDDEGHVEEPSRETVSPIFVIPRAFRANIKPRYQGAERLVRMAFTSA